MDLQTLKKNIKKGVYKKVIDFCDDLQLIWDNCKKYNSDGSDIFNSAVIMEKLSNKLIKEAFLDIPENSKLKVGCTSKVGKKSKRVNHNFSEEYHPSEPSETKSVKSKKNKSIATSSQDE